MGPTGDYGMTFQPTFEYAKFLRIVAVGLFVVSIPLFLIATNVRWVVNAPVLYSYGFDKHKISQRTGIERDELLSAGRQIRDYFNSGDEFLAVSVIVGNVRVGSLFNTREVLHMKDVKGLVKGVYRIQEATGVYLLAFTVIGLLVWRRRFVPVLARYTALGAGATLALVVLTGLGSLVGFDRLFLVFHQISFTNDLWQLDPRTDYLIAMFPQGFFFDATMWIAGSTVVEALVLAGVGLAWWRPARVLRLAAKLTARTEVAPVQ